MLSYMPNSHKIITVCNSVTAYNITFNDIPADII